MTKGKTTMPVLATVRIEAEGDGLSLRATNLQTDIEASCKADVVTPGVVCVTGSQLKDIVSSVKDDMTFELERGMVTIMSGRALFKLVTTPAEEFPAQAEYDAPTAKMTGADVEWLLDGVRKAVSSDDARYNLTGVFVDMAATRVRFVSSDGHRLSYREMTWRGEPVSAIVPVDALEAMAAMGNVSVGLTADRIVAVSAEATLTARCIEGKFPDYEQVVPKTHKGELSVKRDELMAAVKRVMLMAPDAGRTVRFELAGDVWCIAAVTPQLGEASERVDVTADGRVETVGLNGSYLLDALGALDTDTVRVLTGDNQSPVVLLPDMVETTKHVVMPIRL